jgi:hypothetical protein
MATNYRVQLRRAFRACDGDQRPLGTSSRTGGLEGPSEDDWKLLEIMYSIGLNVGYARGFVHATALLFVAMLAAVVWTSL